MLHSQLDGPVWRWTEHLTASALAGLSQGSVAPAFAAASGARSEALRIDLLSASTQALYPLGERCLRCSGAARARQGGPPAAIGRPTK